MTHTEAELYPSFEDFMREDKLPPVFPSSQSSIVSETQVYSQHLISEVCDRDIYGPFGINGFKDDDLPPNFINSSLAYSPKSIPPHSPSIDSSPFNMTSASSSVLDPLDTAIEDADEMLEDPGFNEELGEDGVFLDYHDLVQVLDDAIEKDDELTSYAYEAVLPSPSISPSSTILSSSSTLTSTSVIFETPAVSNVKSEASTSDSNVNQASDESVSVVKKPATRGRKRKLFTNCEEKKKDQNKEAARRYREKKKSEDSRLEAEEAAELERRTELRKEFESLSRAHREIVIMFKECIMDNRLKKSKP